MCALDVSADRLQEDTMRRLVATTILHLEEQQGCSVVAVVLQSECM